MGIRLDMYQVLDGVELWLSGYCLKRDQPSHEHHRGNSCGTFLTAEDVESDFPGAVARAACEMLTEWSEIAARARC